MSRSYGIWGRPKATEARAFNEKGFRRAPLPAWDARWHALSVPARSSFLNDVKGPLKRPPSYGQPTPPSVASEKIRPQVLDELVRAGFVEVRAATGKSKGERVFAVADLADFDSRIRGLRRYHLLDPDQPSMVTTYVNACYSPSELLPVIHGVLRKAGIEDYFRIDDALEHYVLTHRWPGWAVQALGDPLAERILTAIRQADGPVLLAELPARIKGASPDQVRTSLERLIAHLVLYEDLDPTTLDLRVGLLPAVCDALVRASQPRKRPPLLVCDRPKEPGPDEGVVVADLRAFLLEVASEPPRLRQDHKLFQKEIDRFQDVLEPLPPWMAALLDLTSEKRLDQALVWARTLKLVKEVAAGKAVHLQLLPKGQKWLTGSIEEQYAEIYDFYRNPPSGASRYDYQGGTSYSYGAYGYYSESDLRFLGIHMVVLKPAKQGKRPPAIWDAKPADFAALRSALDSLFTALPVGTFYRLDSLAEHGSFGVHNPLLLGTDPDQSPVAIYWNGRPVPPLEERREEAGRVLIDTFVKQRLIPLGCVRTAIDDQGRPCIAREPWLDAYFGRDVAPGTVAPDSRPAETRVVVQPDFSIVIIGPNPAPAAELIPFCERASRGSGRGALVLKLTRNAVVKAVAQGLKPAEILARLKRHASHEVPANVLREVEGWSSWVRRITPETLVVLRCPDREAADRVMGALRKQAERVQDTMVAIAPKDLTAVERRKLEEQGIILGPVLAAREPKPKTRAKRRRY